jgi:hypothetical protein
MILEVCDVSTVTAPLISSSFVVRIYFRMLSGIRPNIFSQSEFWTNLDPGPFFFLEAGTTDAHSSSR